MKKTYIIVMSSVTFILAVVIFAAAMVLPSSKAASKRLAGEIQSLNASTENLNDEMDEIQKQIDDTDTKLSTKDTINNYYLEYKSKRNELTKEVEDLKKQSSELDAQIEKKRIELENSSGVKTEKRGKTYTLEKNKTYSCPDNLPAGRYVASGSGTIVIISSSGQTRAAQNLAVSYNNSYTFNLGDKERIKSDANITLTEIVTE